MQKVNINKSMFEEFFKTGKEHRWRVTNGISEDSILVDIRIRGDIIELYFDKTIIKDKIIELEALK